MGARLINDPGPPKFNNVQSTHLPGKRPNGISNPPTVLGPTRNQLPKRPSRPGFAKVSDIQSATSPPSIVGGNIFTNLPLPLDFGPSVSTARPSLDLPQVSTGLPQVPETTTKKVQLLSDAGKPDSPYELLHRMFPTRQRTAEEKENVLNSLQNEDLGGLHPEEVYLADGDLLIIKGGGFPSAYEENTKLSPISNYNAPPPLPPPAVEPGTLLFEIKNGPRPVNNSLPFSGGAPFPFPAFPGFGNLPNVSFPGIPQPQQGPNFLPFPGSNSTAPFTPDEGFRPLLNPLRPDFGSPVPRPQIESPLGGRPEQLSPPLPGSRPPPQESEEDYDDEEPPPLFPARPVEFYYPTHNTTEVPPGPAGPGIFVPPPSRFFQVNNKNTEHVDLLDKVHDARIFLSPPWVSGFVPSGENPDNAIDRSERFRQPDFRDLKDSPKRTEFKEDNIPPSDPFPFSHDFIDGKAPGNPPTNKFIANETPGNNLDLDGKVFGRPLAPLKPNEFDKTRNNNGLIIEGVPLSATPSFGDKEETVPTRGHQLGDRHELEDNDRLNGRFVQALHPLERTKNPQHNLAPVIEDRITGGGSFEFNGNGFKPSDPAFMERIQKGPQALEKFSFSTQEQFFHDGMSQSEKIDNIEIIRPDPLEKQENRDKEARTEDFDARLINGPGQTTQDSRPIQLVEQLVLFPAKPAQSAEEFFRQQQMVDRFESSEKTENNEALFPFDTFELPLGFGEKREDDQTPPRVFSKPTATNVQPEKVTVAAVQLPEPATDAEIPTFQVKDDVNIMRNEPAEQPLSPGNPQHHHHHETKTVKNTPAEDTEVVTKGNNNPNHYYISQFEDTTFVERDYTEKSDIDENLRDFYNTNFGEKIRTSPTKEKDDIKAAKVPAPALPFSVVAPAFDSISKLRSADEANPKIISTQHPVDADFTSFGATGETEKNEPYQRIEIPEKYDATQSGKVDQEPNYEYENAKYLSNFRSEEPSSFDKKEVHLKEGAILGFDGVSDSFAPFSNVQQGTDITPPSKNIQKLQFSDPGQPTYDISKDLVPKVSFTDNKPPITGTLNQSGPPSTQSFDQFTRGEPSYDPPEPSRFDYSLKQPTKVSIAPVQDKFEPYSQRPIQNYEPRLAAVQTSVFPNSLNDVVKATPNYDPPEPSRFDYSLKRPTEVPIAPVQDKFEPYSQRPIQNNGPPLAVVQTSVLPNGLNDVVKATPNRVSLESDTRVNFRPPLPKVEPGSETVALRTPVASSREAQKTINYPFTFFHLISDKSPGASFKLGTGPDQRSFVSVSHYGPKGIGYSYSY